MEILPEPSPPPQDGGHEETQSMLGQEPLSYPGPAPPPAAPPLGPRLHAGHGLLAFLLYLFAQFAAGVMMGMACGFVYGFTYAMQHPGGRLDTSSADFQSMITGVAIPLAILVGLPAAGGAVWLYAVGWLKATREEVGLTRAPAGALLAAAGSGALLMVLLVVTSGLYVQFLGEPPRGSGPIQNMAAGSPAAFAAWLALAILLAPAVEEFVFRGVMLTGMARSLGPVAAAAVVSALFGLLHLNEAGSFPPAILTILLLAVVLSVFRLRSRSLLPCWVLHTTYNSLLAVLVGLSRWLAPG